MKKEDILAKSRNENKDGDERDVQNGSKAGLVSKVCMIVMCVALQWVALLLEIPVMGSACFMIFMGGMSGEYVYRAIKINRKNDIVCAVLFGVAFAANAVAFVINVIGFVQGV